MTTAAVTVIVLVTVVGAVSKPKWRVAVARTESGETPAVEQVAALAAQRAAVLAAARQNDTEVAAATPPDALKVTHWFLTASNFLIHVRYRDDLVIPLGCVIPSFA